ncbi:MAG TPA: response regulator transcription factor [Solirubrobacteraceae bacterium]|nr:response regulator transcription factor [Solirubrobacteraceae bacterium]
MSRSNEASVRISLIDDDSGLFAVLDRRFDSLGWDRRVLGYAPGPDQLAAQRLHVVVVNPAITGLDYVERTAVALPGLALLVCTGASTLADRVRGLRGGADDWLTKPCHPEELVTRVQAVLRRRRLADLPTEGSAIVAGALSIRPDRFQSFVGDQSVDLTRKEFELLHLLAQADGRVLEREEIYQRVWGYTMVRGDRSVDVFVRKVRQKLEPMSPDWNYLHTQFGVGYRFAAEPRGASGACLPEPATAPWPGATADPPRLRVPDREGVRGPRAYDPF